MSFLQMLDCTLREAPVDGLRFGANLIKLYYKSMVKTGIDIIEVGFLKDVDFEEGTTIYSSVEDIIPYLPEDRGNAKFVALIDYGRFSQERLSDFDGRSIDGIRICFKKHEWRDAIGVAEQIKAKGYLVFFQHVDTLSYSDEEINELLTEVNRIQPYGYSIVDTFGSMYTDDLHRLYSLVNLKLDKNIVLGFHSHNNLMMANALSQEFVNLGYGKRKLMLDSTMLGAGRGAGNAHLELAAVYLNKKFGCDYNLDEILDIIDELVPQLLKKAKWGYSIPYFISGMHSSHVFNVNYLLSRHNIKSKDLTAIIESLDEKHRKLYDYDFLESRYVEYFSTNVDDTAAMETLRGMLTNRNVVVVAPGKSAKGKSAEVSELVKSENAAVIGVNSFIEGYDYDLLFFSNSKRYELMRSTHDGITAKALLSSNIKSEAASDELIVNYNYLVKRGWKNFDNAMILLLRLLGKVGVKSVRIVGFDGFSEGTEESYADEMLSVPMLDKDTIALLDAELSEMLDDLFAHELKDIPVTSLTKSRYF